jgi:ATP-dependent protease Clp ATPase subunit
MTHCSFCGKSQARVRALFESSGLPGCICNECLDICRKILEDDKKRLEKAGTYRTSSTTVAAEVLHCHFVDGCSTSWISSSALPRDKDLALSVTDA